MTARRWGIAIAASGRYDRQTEQYLSDAIAMELLALNAELALDRPWEAGAALFGFPAA